jgi:hypothetical protein
VEMSSTPAKSPKIGRKQKEYGYNNFCRFCGIESGAKAESIFRETVLADCCSSIGFALIQFKSCLNVFVEVVAAKSETLQN